MECSALYPCQHLKQRPDPQRGIEKGCKALPTMRTEHGGLRTHCCACSIGAPAQRGIGLKARRLRPEDLRVYRHLHSRCGGVELGDQVVQTAKLCRNRLLDLVVRWDIVLQSATRIAFKTAVLKDSCTRHRGGASETGHVLQSGQDRHLGRGQVLPEKRVVHMACRRTSDHAVK